MLHGDAAQDVGDGGGRDPRRRQGHRAGAYAARHAAKNVVAAGLAGECEVQLSYSLGRSRPISVQF